MYQSIFSSEHLFFYFSSDFYTYQVDFSVFWALNSWIFCVTSRLVFEFLIFAIFWMLWMLVILNKVKHMALHDTHALQITSWKTLFTQNFFRVFNEIGPILVTRFLGNKSWKVCQKFFCKSVQQNCWEKKQNKTKKQNKHKAYHYVDHLTNISDFGFENIVLDNKSYEKIFLINLVAKYHTM